MPSFMRTETSLFDGFDDNAPTTLDPCLEMEVNGDGMDEKTPMILDQCSECGRALVRLADWIPPPPTAEAAWHDWEHDCVATESAIWQWCPHTAFLTARVRVSWPRRLALPPPAQVRASAPAVHAVPAWIPVSRRPKVPPRLPFTSY